MIRTSLNVKTCSICKEILDINKFGKFRNGLRPSCKRCTNIRNKEYSKNAFIKLNAKKTNKESLYEKKCSTCKKMLHESNFGKLKKAKDGLKSKCKECRRMERKILFSQFMEDKR